MKATLFRIVAIVVFVSIASVIRSRQSWRHKSTLIANQLLNRNQHAGDSSSIDNSIRILQQQQQQQVDEEAFQDLPPAVQRYLQRATRIPIRPALVDEDVSTKQKQQHQHQQQQQQRQEQEEQEQSHGPWIRAVTFQQRGSFRIQGNWVCFTATQYISAVQPVGFLWDATMLMVSPWGLDMPVSVRDVYWKGKGSLEASFGHILTLANLHDNPQIDLGEEQRWLAEAVLVPTALWPSQQIAWKSVKEHEGSQARLILNETISGTIAEMTVEFGSDDLPASVFAMRPKTVEDGSGMIELASWEGKFYDYKVISGMLIPTRMEAGWLNEETGQLEMYFQGENDGFEYIFL